MAGRSALLNAALGRYLVMLTGKPGKCFFAYSPGVSLPALSFISNNVLFAQWQRVCLVDKYKAQFNSQCKYTVQGNYTQFTALQTMPLCITVWN